MLDPQGAAEQGSFTANVQFAKEVQCFTINKEIEEYENTMEPVELIKRLVRKKIEKNSQKHQIAGESKNPMG